MDIITDAHLKKATRLPPPSPYTSLRAEEGDLQHLCDRIVEVGRQRRYLVSGDGSLVRLLRGICRRLRNGSKAEGNALFKTLKAGTCTDPAAIAITADLMGPWRSLAKARAEKEKELLDLLPGLPVFEWWTGTPGLGALGLAVVVAETDNLSRYPNHRHVWKRLGVAVMPDGRQRRVTGAKAIEHGYSPRRRSVLYAVGAAFVKSQGPYREVYLARKSYEIERAEASGLIVAPAATCKDGNNKVKDGYMTLGHVANRSQRYAEKCLVRDLWRLWTRGTMKAPPWVDKR